MTPAERHKILIGIGTKMSMLTAKQTAANIALAASINRDVMTLTAAAELEIAAVSVQRTSQEGEMYPREEAITFDDGPHLVEDQMPEPPL